MMLVAALLAAAPAPPLRLATYAYPAYDRSQALAPLARLIEDETGRFVSVTLYPSPEALADAIRKRHVDVAMTNLAAYIDIFRDPAVRTMAVLQVPAATLEKYRGVLIARRDGGLFALEQLRGTTHRLRYVEVLPGSTSGALVQADALRRAGADRRSFASIDRSGTHDAALEKLLSGQADLAALAEAPWRALKAERSGEAEKLVELWRSAPLPPGPMICVKLRSVPCDRIGARLLRADPTSQAVATELARGWAETAGATRFVRVSERVYRPFAR